MFSNIYVYIWFIFGLFYVLLFDVVFSYIYCGEYIGINV